MNAVVAFIYCRISADRLGTELGVERQQAICRALCEAQGWIVGGVFIDNDKSATNPRRKRPEYERMMARVRAGEAGAIVCVDQDRLVRMMSELVPLLATCEETHTLLLLSSGEIDSTTADGILRAHMLGAVAEFETHKKKERSLRQRDQAAAAGKVHGGPRAFGFELDGVTKRPVEWEAYQELFARVIGGDGLVRIARDWEARGIMAPRTGRGFCTRSLRKLLEAPRAIGMRQHRGVVICPGNWPEVVSAETQRRALAAIASRRSLRTATAPLRPAQLLSSLAICSECERTMRLGWNHQKRRYLCDRSHSGCCGKVTIAADSLEPEVEKQFLALLTHPETLAAINRLEIERPDVRDMLDAVELISDELVQLRQLKADDEITLADYLVLRKSAQQRLDAANAALANATNVPALLTISPADTVARWSEYDLDEKRRRLGAFIECVIVRPVPAGASRKTFVPDDRVRVLWRI